MIEFTNYWLNTLVKPQVKSSTFSNYASIIEKWISPSLGGKKLSSLGKEDIQCFIGMLSEKGLSSGTVRNIFRVLSDNSGGG